MLVDPYTIYLRLILNVGIFSVGLLIGQWIERRRAAKRHTLLHRRARDLVEYVFSEDDQHVLSNPDRLWTLVGRLHEVSK